MKWRGAGIVLLIIFVAWCGCAVTGAGAESVRIEMSTFKSDLISQMGGSLAWSERVPGVMTRLDTDEPVVALTFDACGSTGDGYDKELIDYLMAEGIPATLFIAGRWIDKNPDVFRRLAENPLFQIENHGLHHKPCSIDGKSAYGIKGTCGRGEVIEEIEGNALKIERITGRKPALYRSGTAYYDPACVAIIDELGYRAVNFSVLGDKGASYTADEVRDAFLSAKPGDIIIAHMNHPEKETAEGVIAAIPELRERGYRFVRLAEYGLK